jgi:hypothetical protein
MMLAFAMTPSGLGDLLNSKSNGRFNKHPTLLIRIHLRSLIYGKLAEKP